MQNWQFQTRSSDLKNSCHSFSVFSQFHPGEFSSFMFILDIFWIFLDIFGMDAKHCEVPRGSLLAANIGINVPKF